MERVTSTAMNFIGVRAAYFSKSITFHTLSSLTYSVTQNDLSENKTSMRPFLLQNFQLLTTKELVHKTWQQTAVNNFDKS